MATTSHVELFHQMKNELLRDHEAAIGRTVDHQAWEKAMENYYHMRDLVASQQDKPKPVFCIYTVEQRDSSPEQDHSQGGLW